MSEPYVMSVMHGCVGRQVPLVFVESEQQWVMDYDRMERLITPTTKMFTLCNPHNPVRCHT